MPDMELYLDANATTDVLPSACHAAMEAMSSAFGNPSSTHLAGLRARRAIEEARRAARRALGVASGRIVFTSGATEGIQAAVLSSLVHLRRRHAAGTAPPTRLLYGATEHKAVPEALRHWCQVLDLDFEIQAIPVQPDGRHDLAWLRAHVAEAGLVCTMAVNNESGVVSDLDAIAPIVRAAGALWLVDGVQALGKVPLRLATWGVDYACFSGHKVHAPKGSGLLYVGPAAPFTPIAAGGGQEGGDRAGTENMPGIAALGVVLQALADRSAAAPGADLAAHRASLVQALRQAFPGVVFNAPEEVCVPTTVNFSVPGVASRTLLNLFDAAGLRVSAGSACNASHGQPSHVLEAMGLPSSQTRSAVRLSFSAQAGPAFIAEACRRLRACGEALDMRSPGLEPSADASRAARVRRFAWQGACSYVVVDAGTRQGVLIDPLPALEEELGRWVRQQSIHIVAVLGTQPLAGPAGPAWPVGGPVDAHGWPLGQRELALGRVRLSAMDWPGRTPGTRICLLDEGGPATFAFMGGTLWPAAAAAAAGAAAPAPWQRLDAGTLLLPGHDAHEWLATTPQIERGVPSLPPACTELDSAAFQALRAGGPAPLLVDVREHHEQHLGPLDSAKPEAVLPVPLPDLVQALPRLLALDPARALVFCCRSGQRSGVAAQALRRLGRAQAWSLAGGLATAA